ncbi:MAG: sulfotransferase domain-containing protein [Candidatus Nitrosoglobus sp.]|jgi:hypothetical protein
MHKPNFFIVGAPKAGTTAMSEYLRTHPNVYMSDPKEPNFFSQDVTISAHAGNMIEYLALFNSASPEHLRVGEASTTYLFSKKAPSAIWHFNSEAKIIVMLRRPVDLVYAWHGQLIISGVESITDFENAWFLQKARSQGQQIPPSCVSPELLCYKRIGQLGSHVKALLEIFPRDQVHLILFDDFIANTSYEYQRLIHFLDLPMDSRLEFPRINESRRYKRVWLGQFPRRIRGYIARPLNKLRKQTGFKGTGLLRLIDRFNVKVEQRLPMRSEFRQYLQEQFHDEVLLLQELLGQQLSSWLEDK